MDNSGMIKRVGELEVKLSFAEDMLDQVNLTVYRQQQQIDQLQQKIHSLRQLMEDALPAEQRSLRDEIPPHY